MKKGNLTACLAVQLICSRVHCETSQRFLVVQAKFGFEVTAKRNLRRNCSLLVFWKVDDSRFAKV